jgi:hypothetical protein
VPPARENVGGRAVRDHRALAEQHDPVGQLGRELGVMGGDEDRRAPVGEVAQPGAERVLVRAVHAAGRLVEADDGRRDAAQHDLEREPLALAAGEVTRVGPIAAGQPGGGDASGAQLLLDALVDQVVAGVLEEEGDLAAALDLPPRRLDEALEVPEEGRLASAVAAHERHALARFELEVDAAEDCGAVLDLVPQTLDGNGGG